jgi:hypothetical protein
MKSKEKRMRKLRSVKLSAPRPKLHRMRSRIDGPVRIMPMLGKGVVLASWGLQQGLSELGMSYHAAWLSTRVGHATAGEYGFRVHNTLTSTKNISGS